MRSRHEEPDWCDVSHRVDDGAGRLLLTLAVVVLGIVAMVALTRPDSAVSSTHPAGVPSPHTRGTSAVFRTAIATWYGPGFVGNHFACAGHRGLPPIYRQSTRGVANLHMPCGTRVVLAYHGRHVVVPVIDRGPFRSGVEFDLTARTAMDLCACSRPYTMTLRWHTLTTTTER